MPYILVYASQFARMEEELAAAATPLWVPLIVSLLVTLLFVWGLTRGNVLDENLPEAVQARSSDEHREDGELH